jgi:hypothetical protein
VLSYGGVTPKNVTPLVHGAMFTRGPEELRHTAIWVGGSNVSVAEEIFDAVRKTFFGPFTVSIMMDADGCNTTAAATVAALAAAGPLGGQRAVVLGGTGPVGLRVAELLAREGARAMVVAPWPETLGDRWDAGRAERAAARAEAAGQKAGFGVRRIGARAELPGALEGASVAVAAGSLGANLLQEKDWQGHPTLRFLADLNPIPPLGIEGMKATDFGKVRHDKTVFGALGLGGLKMKIHKKCVAQLFEARDRIFDQLTVYGVARSVSA